METGTRRWRRHVVWAVAVAAAAVVLWRVLRPNPVLVDTATIARGRLVVSVDDDGRTRVRERYTISAPIEGRLLRTALDPGDAVQAHETLIAEFEPVASSLLDVRSRREAEARLSRAEAAVKEAAARRAEAAAAREYAVADLARTRELAAQGIVARDALDRAVREEARAREAERAAAFAADVARYERDVARASLLEDAGAPFDEPPLRAGEPTGTAPGVTVQPNRRRLLLRSPISGTVLRVFEESARTLAAGTPILEVGSTDALEIVADYLSEDAVKVRPGMPVLVEGWGGEGHLRGRVRVVEPGGFTKISALGVEEQRVNIVVDPVDSDEGWNTLGDGYRVELRIMLWEGADVLIVPTGALFREEDAWTVFVVDDGVARRRAVELGRQSGLEAEVRDGLVAGDEVILYPSALVTDGSAVHRHAPG